MKVTRFTENTWPGLLLLGVLITTGCGGGSVPAKVGGKSGNPAVDTVPQRRDADDTARFLAGMPGKPGSPFAELETTSAWQQHRQVLDEAWKGTEGSL